MEPGWNWDGTGIELGWSHSSPPVPSGQGSVPPLAQWECWEPWEWISLNLGIKYFLLLNRIFSPSSHGCSCPNPSQFFSSTFPFSWTHLGNRFVFLFPVIHDSLRCGLLGNVSLSLCFPQLWRNDCTRFQFPLFSMVLPPSDASFLPFQHALTCISICIWRSPSQASKELLFPSFFPGLKG